MGRDAVAEMQGERLPLPMDNDDEAERMARRSMATARRVAIEAGSVRNHAIAL